MDEEQEELSTHEASLKSGMSQGHLASLLRQHKLEGSYNSKQRRWMVNAAALERYLTVDDRTGVRRCTYASRLYERAQQAVDDGQFAQAEPLYQKALTLFDGLFGTSYPESIRIRNNLGHLYCEQQRYREAEVLFLQALKSGSGVKDISLLSALLTNISHLYMVQDRFAEAEPYLYQRQRLVAECMEKVLYRIGRARQLMDEQSYADAEGLLAEAEYYLKYTDPHDVSFRLAFYLTRLRLVVLQEKQKDVHHLLKKVYPLLSPDEGEEEIDDALFLYQLAEKFRKKRKLEEAEPLYHYAIKLFEQENEDAVTRMLVGLALNGLGQLYHEQEHFHEAEATYLRALSTIETLRGTAHPDLVLVLHSLVALAVDQENYRDALLLLERAQAIEKKAPELDDRSAATMLYDDANRLFEQGQLAEAEALLRRALTFDEQAHGPDYSAVVDDLTLLAYILLKQGQLDEAELHAQRALGIGERQGEKRSAAIVAQLHLLVLITRAQGKKQEARTLQRRVTACNKLGPQPDDINSIFAFHAPALHAVTQGRYAEAEALLQHTLTVHGHILGQEHPHVVLYQHQLAEVYCLQGKFHLAEPLLIRILAWTKQSGSDLAILVATSLYQLAQFSLVKLDMTRAERLIEHAYSEVGQAVGLDHVVVGIALTTKAHLLFLQDKNEEAEETAQRAQALLISSPPARSLVQLCAEQTLAQIYNDMDQHENAESLARRALREAERQLVVDHPLLMFLLHTLAVALSAQRKYQRAETLYQRALMIAEQVFEPTHDLILTLLKGLGHIYWEQNQYAFAELTFKQILEICERRDDQNPLQIHILQQQIGLMCMLQGKAEEGREYLERVSPFGSGETRPHLPANSKDSLSFLQEAMMEQARKKEI